VYLWLPIATVLPSPSQGVPAMRTLVLSVLLLAPAVAAAGPKPEAPPVPMVVIIEQQKQIRADDQAQRGRYRELPTGERVELLSKQLELLSLIEDKASSQDLSAHEQVEVFNRLEWIEAKINGTEEERTICYRERILGSQRVTRICHTVAEQRAERERARQKLDHRPRQLGTAEL
jgi:hypothetical protein